MSGDPPRSRAARHLEWKVRIFGAGALIAVVGMATGQRWLVNVAIAVLVVGVGLRFLDRREEPTEDEEPEGS